MDRGCVGTGGRINSVLIRKRERGSERIVTQMGWVKLEMRVGMITYLLSPAIRGTCFSARVRRLQRRSLA
jgi:hypothetical protein